MSKPNKPAPRKRKPTPRKAKRGRKPDVVERRRAGRRRAERQREVLTKVDADTPANSASLRPRASWRRYFQACVSLLERGLAPTLVNIAKELRVSKQTVWALQRRHPELLVWINEEFVGKNRTLFGPLQFRLGQLGIQGHMQAADLYLRSLTMGFGTIEPAASANGGNMQVTQVYLVPRPDYPPLEPVKVLPPPVRADIPTVAVR
jgi:hypothetical protein